MSTRIMTRLVEALIGVVLISLAVTVSAAAQSSCSAWKTTCYGRCADKGANCKASCDFKYATCRKSGCFTEGPAYGGRTHCALAKK